MQLFYAKNLIEGLVELPESEARHIVQVLRKRAGDFINLVDGTGGWYRGEIISTGKKSCSLEVTKIRQETQRASYTVTLAFGPPKTADRLEWLLEKATEIGVDRLQPFVSEHSERRKLKAERLEKVLESAMKQSLQAWLPTLLPLCKFEELLDLTAGDLGLMAWIDKNSTVPLFEQYKPQQNVTILIGPEGGFSPAEATTAIAAGFKIGSLGQNRLRTETAVIAALRDVAFINRH